MSPEVGGEAVVVVRLEKNAREKSRRLMVGSESELECLPAESCPEVGQGRASETAVPAGVKNSQLVRRRASAEHQAIVARRQPAY